MLEAAYVQDILTGEYSYYSDVAKLAKGSYCKITERDSTHIALIKKTNTSKEHLSTATVP